MKAPLRRFPQLSLIAVLARREAQAAVRGMGSYIALTVALLAASWLIAIDVKALETAGVLVRAEPLRAPLAMAILVLCAFFAVSAAVSTSRERENGTLEVLFYGPVSPAIYIAGKVAGQLVAYVAALPLLLVSFLVLSKITGFAMSPMVLASSLLSVVPAAAIISFAVMLSIGTSKVRSAVLLIVGVIALLIGVKIAYGLVALIPISDPSSSLVALRDALLSLDTAFRWISPFAYLERVVDAGITGDWWKATVNSAIVFAGVVGLMGLAVARLRRHGVYGRGG
jgi:ABC-type transport system involved in multi-copper enzyme maturation permease subunit